MATHRMSVQIADPPGAGGQPSPLEPPSGSASYDDIHKEEIELQLQRILASHSFKNSKRSMHFLRFVVEKALAGATAEIKERLIGVEVFDRPLHYDLSADPIVRVGAVELRKRIAQYYAEPDHASELRVELPLGSYVPLFHWPNSTHKRLEDVATAETPGSPTKEGIVSGGHVELNPLSVHKLVSPRKMVMLAGVILLAAIGAVFAAHYSKVQRTQRSLDEFWAPLMNGGDSITVCVGDLNYIFKSALFDKLLQLHPSADNVLNANAGAALLRVGTILGSRGKRSTLRLADHTELNDLRQQPVIFIGGMNNPWTQRILGGLRFRLTAKPGGINGDYGLLIDVKNPSITAWRVDLFAPLDSITRDYSVVTRLNDPLTGEPVVILSGLGPYGTAAASEFVSDPRYFSEFSKSAPNGWQNRGFQIVLETTVVDGRVSIPRVIAEQIY